jgi:ferrous iron transport protein B
MGERGVIVKVYGNGGFRKRIVEMGFIVGNMVEVVMKAPLRDPIVYQIIGYKVSLRREEASMIEVLSESEAEQHIKSPQTEDQHPLESHEPQVGMPAADSSEQLQELMKRLAEERGHHIRVALVGNPNCGKTSLFNIASGSHEHVGNYSGVTVDAKEGHFDYAGYHFTIVDLPGTYSLSAYSPEELYVRKNLIENTPDIIINVVDGSNLERNLYLTMQLIDMNLPMVIALNMYDELLKSGDKFDYPSLASMLGTPIVPTVCRNSKGIGDLFDTVISTCLGQNAIARRHIHVNHGDTLEQSINRVRAAIADGAEDLSSRYSLRFLAIKLLENDSDIRRVIETKPNAAKVSSVVSEEEKRIEDELQESSESAIVDAKYGFISGALKETYHAHQRSQTKRTLTERIDAVVTNKYWGYPVFFLILFLMFEATFKIGQYPMDWIDDLVGWIGQLVGQYMPAGILKDLITDGIIGGVGAVIVFLPNILILYFIISILEDSGYMARAAFMMDKLMHKMGLHGKSFIPMIMGFGCNVPAIMASRTIESPKSRLVTMLVTPLMSCSARLPLYIILIGAFFPHYASLVLLSLYALGIVMAIIMARIFSRIFMKKGNLPFVMELPPYRMPTLSTILRHTWEKGKQYLKKMGNIILTASIIIWALGYFPRPAAQETAAQQQEQSYLARIGRFITPVMKPMHFDWRMNAGLIAGTGAKELVVSTMGVLYSGVDQDNTTVDTDAAAEDEAAQETHLQKAVQHTMTPLSAAAYLVFVLLYFPCLATIAAIRNETGTWKWAIFTAVYTTVLAYVMSMLVYQIGSLIV